MVLDAHRNSLAGRSFCEVVLSPYVPIAVLWGSILVDIYRELLAVAYSRCPNRCFPLSTPIRNGWAGCIVGGFTLTLYEAWQQSHVIHYATMGNLDTRAINDARTLAGDEYPALDKQGQLFCRVYRHPLVFLGIWPSY